MKLLCAATHESEVARCGRTVSLWSKYVPRVDRKTLAEIKPTRLIQQRHWEAFRAGSNVSWLAEGSNGGMDMAFNVGFVISLMSFS